MSDDILPCPFCGAEAHTFTTNGVLQATCDDFNCPAFDVFAPIFLWNRRAIPATDAREAAAVVLDAMNDGEVWGRAVNAAMPIINADLDQSAWVTVSEVREALVAALRALIDEARDD